MTTIRLTQRQVQALWREMYRRSLSPEVIVPLAPELGDPLTHDESLDLEARLYVAAHPELVQHVIELDVER